MASEKFLLNQGYDNDATIIGSDSEHDSAFESEASDSPDVSRVKQRDRSVLENNDEEEELLAKPRRFEAVRQALTRVDESTERRRQERRGIKKARRRRQSANERDNELMFEMEGGFKDSGAWSSQESFEAHQTKWAGEKRSKRAFCCRIALLQVLILLLFVALAFGAYKLSRSSRNQSLTPTLSNGTHTFKPTTILISLDGFRADFLNRDITPALAALISSGVSPRWMLPSFPSVTFPNHFTLVTGLYPESHGIVGNQFWDPALQEEFYYTNTTVSMQAKWWTAEPLWVTAENQGVRTAIHMWPGSEAHIPDVDPTYLDKFNDSEALPVKANRILSWLDLPGDDDNSGSNHLRPQLIAAYVPNVDEDGHKFGPNSTEIRGTIANVDSMLTMLIEGLYTRNLTEIVNIVVVSDHGMATTSLSRALQTDDLVDLSLVDHIDGWPLRGLRLKNPDRDVPLLYEQLSAKARETDGFDVYTLETMPERYHFANNDRIAPLWIVPKTGWAVVEKKDFDLGEAQTIGKPVRPMGLHGYDHEHPLMRAIFVARGPAFPHAPNSRIPIFQNIEVYNILCDSLGITPHPNNGTLRLPLKTEGLHSDPEAAPLDTPNDPVDAPNDLVDDNDDQGDELPTQGETNGGVEEDYATPSLDADTVDSNNKDSQDDKASKDKTSAGWWEFMHDQIQKAKDWANQLVDSIKGNKADKNED